MIQTWRIWIIKIGPILVTGVLSLKEVGILEPTKASRMEKGSWSVSSNHWFHSASLCWSSASVGITEDVSSPVTQTKHNAVHTCPATIVISAYFLLCCSAVLHQFMFHSEDVNCILTDWRGGSSGLYTDAVNNVRIVGAELEYLVNFLEVKIPPECAQPTG